MKRRGKKAWKKEDHSEEWCFVCKDGGDMIICDHKDCFKSYHPECVELKSKTKGRFICGVHKCDGCGRSSDVHCYCCPKGVCRRCIKSADFVHVRGKRGFCGHCLKLALLVEENKDVDSDGETIDFNNRNTYETLFKEYWEIINSTEELTLQVLVSAKGHLRSGKNYDSDKYDESEEYQCSDSEEEEEEEEEELQAEPGKKNTKKRSKPEKKAKAKAKANAKSNKNEFTGWGSTILMQFLTNIGQDTTIALSQRKLETIIKQYSFDNNLIQKNKTVECDASLRSLFKRKTIKTNRIYDSLETHLLENQVSSDEDELGFDSEDNDADVREVRKRKRHNNGDKEEAPIHVPRKHFRFASIVPENIRLVYLRRSLVQKLETEPQTFESKVTGSFVRVKQDVNGCFSKTCCQLMQVTGVKKCLVGENDQTLVLESLETDIPLNALSDDDFSEEECQALKNKVKSGLLKKLELVELEEKARSLHKDIVTHWIPRELALLKHRIDQANEKGWRKELFEFLERRAFLQNPKNQSELVEKISNVVPDMEEEASEPDFVTLTSSALVAPASEKLAMALQLEEFFGSKENKSKKASVVKNPTQLFESGDISKEEVQDIESSEWYVTSPAGHKVGPVSLSVLKNWTQNRAASESKIYKATQTQQQAKSMTAVLRMAFPTN